MEVVCSSELLGYNREDCILHDFQMSEHKAIRNIFGPRNDEGDQFDT
jgi:hypothetical protein